MWTRVLDHVYQFQDSCHVYAVQGSDGTVLVKSLHAAFSGDAPQGDDMTFAVA